MLLGFLDEGGVVGGSSGWEGVRKGGRPGSALSSIEDEGWMSGGDRREGQARGTGEMNR